jgi:hypothetical protein
MRRVRSGAISANIGGGGCGHLARLAFGIGVAGGWLAWLSAAENMKSRKRIWRSCEAKAMCRRK